MNRTPKAPTGLDSQIGEAIRLWRMTISMSQAKLAAATGVTFQQIQKYESGTNRVTASRLQAIADALGVPITELLGSDSTPRDRDGGPSSEAMRLASAFDRLDEIDREAVKNLVQRLDARKSV